MRKLFAILLLLCCLCFGEDSPRCDLIEKAPALIREAVKMPWNGIEADTKEKCPCTEVIVCKKEEYCITAKCPSDNKPESIFKTPSAAELSDHQQ